MEVIFNKVFIAENSELFWGYIILIILVMIVTILLVNKELRHKK